MSIPANVALNKTAQASSFVKPYAPSRAVDGSLTPVNRWLCNTVPCWLSVDLGENMYINRWVVKHMPLAGWRAPDYNMTDFKLQGSSDNKTWYDIDVVTGNTSTIIDRQFTAISFRYARLYVTRGIRTNLQLASCMEFEVYQAPTNPCLQNIAISSGALTPTFSSNVYQYSAMVDNEVANIIITPVAIDPKGNTITINGVKVVSGNPSQLIPLNFGENIITIKCAGVIGDTTSQYTLKVTRAAALTGISAAIVGGATISLSPSPFDQRTFAYTGTIEYSDANFAIQNVEVTPTAGPGLQIKYGGNLINSGTPVTITPAAGDNIVRFDVSALDGTGQVSYDVTIIRKNSSYLSTITSSKGKVSPTPMTKGPSFNYAVKVGATASATTLTLTAEDTSSIVTLLVDSITYTNNTYTLSQSITSISSIVKIATVTVASNTGVTSTVYTINLSK